MILHLSETGSTNDWLRANAANLSDGQWVRADRQTTGRGRHGRPWAMPLGNLAASCLIRLQTREDRAAELGFVAAIALYDAVATVADPARLHLKWPNDLMLDGAKLSGILLERDDAMVILGIGVNLAAAPDVPGRKTASLMGAILPGPFAERLAGAFADRRRQWREDGFATIRSLWLARAHPPGTALRVKTGAEEVSGFFAGLSADGALLLDRDGGTRISILAGDVWEGNGDATGD